MSEEDYFADDEGHLFERSINSIARAGITLGCNPPANDEFCPDRAMTRGEMAAMLRGHSPSRLPEDYFLDDDGNRFEDVINRSPEQGSRSAAILRERPLLPERTLVTRAQMATFLTRSLGLSQPPSPPAQSGPHGDPEERGPAAPSSAIWPHTRSIG